jgi:hypothetical protein
MTQIVKGRFDGSKASYRKPLASPEFPQDRCVVDAKGERVLIGLTAAETREFKTLDALPPSDGEDIGWTFGGEPTTAREKRWLELYTRHNEAWRACKTGDNPAPAQRLPPRLRLAGQDSGSGKQPGKR